MYPNPIPLSDGTVTVNYDYRGASENASTYIGPVGTLPMSDVPKLQIKHQTSKVNTINQTRRSLVRIDHPVADSAGNRQIISVYVVVSIPEKFTDADVLGGVITQMKSFLSATGYITRLINGEI